MSSAESNTYLLLFEITPYGSVLIPMFKRIAGLHQPADIRYVNEGNTGGDHTKEEHHPSIQIQQSFEILSILDEPKYTEKLQVNFVRIFKMRI